MAINPELITTIRVDQLPDGTLNLTNKIPHTSGTVLEKASVQELVDLVATAIGVSGGVGYIAISVTDGQQLPDVPELPSFFLCGAGTFLNINGYPNIICTENLNAIMSLTDHWELAVEIPINPLSGTVQSVTGSAVDNTDPLNPVINEIIFGVQNIIAGTNITVDNTDPANPIISATGGAGTPTLQEVTTEGNETTNAIKVIDASNSSTQLQQNGLVFEDLDDLGTTSLLFQQTSEVNEQIIEIRPLGGTMALLSDITTPTLQEVLDEGDAAIDSAIFLSNTANDFETSVNEFGDGQINLKSVVNDTLTTIGAGQVYLGTVDGTDNAIIDKDGINVNSVSYAFPSGTSSPLATLADIPTGGSGIPHATASGTDTYTATITGVAAYTDADAYLIRFTNGNTTGATLNINSLGAKTLYRNNDGALIGGDIINGGEMLCIYNTSLNGFQVIGTAPNSLFAYVTNDDSVTITKGMPVYAFSGTGDRMTVKRANNSADATSAQTVGLVLSTSIASGQKGLIMMQGLLDGLSILPTATFADGDAVYLGATAGTITNVKPYAPNHLVYLGVVTTASNGSAGRMYVRVQNGYELSEIHDVDLISNAPTNNQALTYETSTDLWKNKTIIEDSITNGVTTIAPSQNAVFDALALKQNIVSLYNLTSQITHTGTTAKTLLLTYFIPANTFTNGDFLNFSALVTKAANIGSTTHTIEINTTNTLTGATIISTAGFNTTNFSMKFKREIALTGGNGYVLNISNNTQNDQTINALPNVMPTFTYNLAADLYLFVTCQLSNATDSITYRGVSITKN